MVPWHLQPKYTKGASQTKSTAQRNLKDIEKIRERKRLKKEQKKQHKSRSSQASTESTGDCTEPTLEESASNTGGLLGDLSALDLSDEDFDCPKGGSIPASINLESRIQHFIESTEATGTTANNGPNKDSIVTDTTQGRPSPLVTDNTQGLEDVGYQTFQRYYHVFRRGELVKLFSKLDNVEVIEEFFDHENWCVIARKL